MADSCFSGSLEDELKVWLVNTLPVVNTQINRVGEVRSDVDQQI